MQATLDTTTGRYSVKATIRMNGEVSEKVKPLVVEGILSKALYRGVFPDCRKLIAGLDLKDKKAKPKDGFKVMNEPFDLTIAGKIRELVETELTATCDGVETVEVVEYVPGEAVGGGTKRTEESLRQLIRLGVMKPMGDEELKALAVSMKESK